MNIVNHKKNQTTIAKEFVENMKPVIEDYIRQSFINVETITIDDKKTEVSPMGSIEVYGYINNDPKLNFDTSLQYNDKNEYKNKYIGATGMSPSLAKMDNPNFDVDKFRAE